MAIIYTPRGLGMRVLHEFYVRNRCPGECHAIGTFINTPGWNSNDLETGLNYCVERGWLDQVNDSWFLTEEGFRVATLEGERCGDSGTTSKSNRSVEEASY